MIEEYEFIEKECIHHAKNDSKKGKTALLTI